MVFVSLLWNSIKRVILMTLADAVLRVCVFYFWATAVWKTDPLLGQHASVILKDIGLLVKNMEFLTFILDLGDEWVFVGKTCAHIPELLSGTFGRLIVDSRLPLAWRVSRGEEVCKNAQSCKTRRFCHKNLKQLGSTDVMDFCLVWRSWGHGRAGFTFFKRFNNIARQGQAKNLSFCKLNPKHIHCLAYSVSLV